MAPVSQFNSRRKRKGLLDDGTYNQAVERLKNESSVRRRMQDLQHRGHKLDSGGVHVNHAKPENEKRAADRLRKKRGAEQEFGNAKGALGAPRRGGSKLSSLLKGREPKHETDKGLRRLSYKEAYSRRTTDSSRARVMDLYNRTAPPTAPKPSPFDRRNRKQPTRGGKWPNVPRPGDKGGPIAIGPVRMNDPARAIAEARKRSSKRASKFPKRNPAPRGRGNSGTAIRYGRVRHY
jgi:hypothetical protein